TAEQKQTVSSILSLGGAAVGVTGGSTADTVAGGQAAQRAVENNTTVEELRIEAVREAELRNRDPEWDKAYRLGERKQLEVVNFLADFIPVIGDIKGFAEAETKGDY
ncbi:VENN motif pre-toxin domain-containing protein, partial [Neisseria dentiae]|uniref:VENN motif pre-toxin domain-containing protein n=1 Tax=Neisseria dentiae TaxID=194197 RepID=UPI00211CEFBE